MEYKNSDHPVNIRNNTDMKGRRQSLSSARSSFRARKQRNRIASLLVAVPVIIVAGWLLFDKLFVIRNFRISGNNEYTAEQAELAAESIGIHKGAHIFGFDKKAAEAKAKYSLSEFDSIKVTFEMPDTVVLKVEEAVPSMYIIYGDKGYVLSESLRVISACNDTSECDSMGLIRIELDNIVKCVAGEFLVTEGKKDELVKRLYSVFEEEGIAADITAIDVSDKFDITFNYKKQFEVKLGDEKNITVKIRYMKAIIKELKGDDSGVIDVSDDEYRDATFKPYNKM